MIHQRRLVLAVVGFVISFATAGDVHATSCVRVRAETAELELQTVTIDGKPAPAPPIYASTVVRVYRNYDGSVHLHARQAGHWLWEETFEP